MSSKREWLSYIHVYTGPVPESNELRFLATDAAGAGMQVASHAATKIEPGWQQKIAETFDQLVDPATLEVLRLNYERVVDLIRQRSGSIWILPSGVQIR